MNEGDAPAWSDGSDIYINKSEIEFFDLEELVQINGLNYHELSHHLYSPRKGTVMMKWVIENERKSPGYMSACNILEDQRIETLFSARYPAIIPYLTQTILRWLANSKEAAVSNYVAIRGRRYLPLELRVAFRDHFYKPELIPAIVDIVDQYRVLAFPKDYDKAQELIKRFKEEVLDNMDLPDVNMPDGGPSGCGHREPVKKGTPEPGKMQQKDADRAKGMGQAEPLFIPKPQESKESDEDQQSVSSEQGDEQGDGVNTNNGPGNADGDGTNNVFVAPTTIQEALKQRDTTVRNAPAGQGSAQSLGGIPDNIVEIMESIENDIYNRKDVLQDVKIKQRVIIGGDGKHEDAVRPGKYDSVPVPNSVLLAARRFARELERLKQDCEPTWQKEMSSGRVNVQRVIRGCEIDNAFDRWEEGSDGTDIEAVLLLDRSGSMGSDNNDMRASEAGWVIKRALEQISASTTIYAFDDKTELVSNRNERANKTSLSFVYGSGGTNPHNALIATERLLKTSRRKTKMMFLITDGEFDHNKNDDMIKRMNAMGVITVMILIANPKQLEYLERQYTEEGHGKIGLDMFHSCTIRGSVTTAADLLPFAKQVVTTTIRSAIHA